MGERFRLVLRFDERRPTDRNGGPMKVVRRGFVATVTLSLVWAALGTSLLRAEDEGERRHDGPAPFDSQRPPDDGTGPSLETLRRNLKESAPGSAAYWTAAHGLLKALWNDAKKLDDLEAELSDRRKTLFQELRKARGNADNEAIRKTALTGSGDAKEAAKAELDRRVSDPNVQFIAKEFGARPEQALKYTAALLAALEAKDEKKLGELIAKMLGTIDSKRRDTLAKHTEEALKDPAKLKEKGLNEALIRKLFDAATWTQTKAGEKTPFIESLEKTLGEVKARNEKFYANIARVVRGGEDGKRAREELLRDYDPEVVADFINTQLVDGNDGRAVDVARAFAREDKDGNLFLDLEASNFAFGDRDRNQSLLLGNKSEPEQIRAALAAFQTGEQRGHDGEMSPEFNGAKTDRLQRFRFAPTANEGAVRLFAGDGDAGKPSLRRSQTPIPTEKLAKQRIGSPHELPPPPPETTPTVTATPSQPVNEKISFQEVKTSFERPVCNGACHQLKIEGTSIATMTVAARRGPKPLKDALAYGLSKMSLSHIGLEDVNRLRNWLKAL